MMKPKCHLCEVEIDKKEDHYYKLYKLTGNGNKIYPTYFCDDICMMDHLINASFADDKSWRIESDTGTVQTLGQFIETMRK